ncbi:MAG: cupin domain-containing protein [Flavisolibacter sp.]|nr:cupin domain-containing protein [Flavisolibacter sp.]
MKNLVLLFWVLLPVFVIAQQDSILSGVYQWKEPKKQSQNANASAILFEGKAYDMEWLQMSANELYPSKYNTKGVVPANEEHLIIIKSGNLSININNSAYSIGAGSVALLMPDEKFALKNQTNQSCKYYVMKYRNKLPIDMERGKTAGGSLIKDWNNIEFKPHDKGGRRDFFERPTAMFKRLEIHVTTLKEGLKSHDPHTHKAEEIVLVTEGKTEMQIGDQLYKGGAGSIYYLGSNVPHALQNIGQQNCTYFAIQFE